MTSRVLGFVLAFGAAVAAAEPGGPTAHDEMAAALETQLDLSPPSAKLPAATTSGPAAVKASVANNTVVHGPGNGEGLGQAEAILHHAEAAANAAVGDERAEGAENRAKMHPPHLKQ